MAVPIKAAVLFICSAEGDIDLQKNASVGIYFLKNSTVGVRDANHWLKQGIAFSAELCQNISSADLQPSAGTSPSLSFVGGKVEGCYCAVGFARD